MDVCEAGLHVDLQYPYMGASPDGIINCECCGKGVLEIKCPFCVKNETIDDATNNKTFCLIKGNTTHLDRKHQYYFQVQAQIILTKSSYCDFVVWTEKEIFIERILPDMHFFEIQVKKVDNFYLKCILPELLAKYYTQITPVNETSANILITGSICYCKADKIDVVLTCASDSCAVQKFHQTCLGLKNKPKNNWLCPDCRVQKRRM